MKLLICTLLLAFTFSTETFAETTRTFKCNTPIFQKAPGTPSNEAKRHLVVYWHYHDMIIEGNKLYCRYSPSNGRNGGSPWYNYPKRARMVRSLSVFDCPGGVRITDRKNRQFSCTFQVRYWGGVSFPKLILQTFTEFFHGLNFSFFLYKSVSINNLLK